MELSNDLVSEFTSVMRTSDEKPRETTCYGKVIVTTNETTGVTTRKVQLDGSDVTTPATFTVPVKPNDRVMVILKNRQAIVIANITNPELIVGTLKANDKIVVLGSLTTNEYRSTYNDTVHGGLTFDSNGIGACDTTTGLSWWLKKDGTFQFGGENGIGYANSKVTLGTGVTLLADSIKGTKAFGDWSLNFGTGELTIGTINVNKLQGTIGDPTGTGPYIDFGNKTMSIGSISADDITTGTLSVSLIQNASIPNAKLSGSVSGGNNWSINLNAGTMTIGNISADNITSGTLTLGGSNNTNGSLLIKNASGVDVGWWDNAGIRATAGKIGGTNGWDIGVGYLRASYTVSNVTKYVGMGINGTTYAFYANASNSSGSDGVFRVDHAGNLTATSATIIGSITATSLTLNSGVTIPASTGVSGLASVATSGKYGDLSNKPDLTIYIAKDGTIGTVSDGTNGFKVASTGALTASNAIIYGTIYASAGTIGGLTLSGNTMYTSGHSAWNTAANGVFISGTGDYPLSIGSGGAFYVTKQGVPHCNGSSLYINSAPAVGSDSSGIAFQISNSLVGEICVARESASVSNVEITGYYGGISLNGNTWIALSAPSVTTYGSVKITNGSNLYLKAASTDPGDLIFLDSSENEMGRIWNNNNTMYFRAGPSGTDFVVGQSTNYSYNTILVGASKSNYYSQPGVSVMSNGNITLTYDGGGAGIYFAYNKASAYTVGLYEAASGNLTCTGELFSNNTIRAGYDTLNAAMAVQVMNSKNKIGLRVDADGNCGIYYYNYNSHSAKWLLKFDVNGNQV